MGHRRWEPYWETNGKETGSEWERNGKSSVSTTIGLEPYFSADESDRVDFSDLLFPETDRVKISGNNLSKHWENCGLGFLASACKLTMKYGGATFKIPYGENA